MCRQVAESQTCDSPQSCPQPVGRTVDRGRRLVPCGRARSRPDRRRRTCRARAGCRTDGWRLRSRVTVAGRPAPDDVRRRARRGQRRSLRASIAALRRDRERRRHAHAAGRIARTATAAGADRGSTAHPLRCPTASAARKLGGMRAALVPGRSCRSGGCSRRSPARSVRARCVAPTRASPRPRSAPGSTDTASSHSPNHRADDLERDARRRVSHAGGRSTRPASPAPSARGSAGGRRAPRPRARRTARAARRRRCSGSGSRRPRARPRTGRAADRPSRSCRCCARRSGRCTTAATSAASTFNPNQTTSTMTRQVRRVRPERTGAR